MKLKLTLAFFLLSKLAFAASTALIDPKTIKDFEFQQKLKEAFQHSKLDLITVKNAQHNTYVVLVKHLKFESGKISFAAHFSQYQNESYSRMLTFSESESKWLGLRPAQKESFFKDMAIQIAKQLEIEADLRSGEKLNKGYFSNFGSAVSTYKEAPKPRKPRSVPMPKSALEIDLVKDGTVQRQPLPKDTQPQKKQQVIEDLVITPEPPQAVEPSIEELMTQNVDDVDITHLEQEFQKLESQMLAADSQKKSELFTKQAVIYLQIGDTDEALSFLNQAIALDDNNKKAKKLRKKILPPPPSISERIRSFTKANKLSINLKHRYEYDSNIVLEAKDPTQPTNKDDAVYSAALSVSKAWEKGHSTQYSYFFDIHAENKDFDLMAHTLSHSWNKKLSDDLFLILPLSLSHYSLEHDGLLWNSDLGPILVWKFDPKWTSIFELGLRDSTYFDDANSGLEAQQTRFKMGFQKALDAAKKQSFNAKVTYINEDAELKTIAYKQIGLELGYSLKLEKVIDQLKVNALFHDRSYDEAAAGFAKREDDRLTFKLSLSKNVFQGQSIQVDFNYLDNDSNLDASKYDKYKVGLAWNIGF